MIGLITKDMYCLRKNLKTFICVTIGVITVAVLFLVSSRCGNVALGMEQMKKEDSWLLS